MYYLQTRYYDPELGRFISADSIEYLDPETLGGLNLYAYCGNNPVMGIDPEGTKEKNWKDTWWGQLLIGIGIAVAAVTFAIAVVASAGAVGALAGTAAAAIGLTATTVSTIVTVASIATIAVGVGIGIFGISDAIEVWSGGLNPVRDWLMDGNQNLYNNTKLAFNIAGSVATIAGTIAPKVLQKIARTGVPKISNGTSVGYQRNFTDFQGKWNFRIDATTHGNPALHHNPHIHSFFMDKKQGGFSDSVYYFWEIIINMFRR